MLTVTQAAGLLGVCRERVKQFIREGRLRAKKTGIMYLIEPKDFERFAKIKRTEGWKKGKRRGRKS